MFVGFQIRQNTRALKATSHHAVTDSFNALNALVISDQNTARIYRCGLANFDSLDEDEATSFGMLSLGYMRIFETLYYQYQTSTLATELYEAELNTLKWSARQPGFRAWRVANPISLSTAFRTFIDGLIRDVQAQA